MKKLIIPMMLTIGYISYADSYETNHSYKNEVSHHTHNTKFNVSENEIFKRKLLVPPLVKGEIEEGKRVFELDIQKGKWEFLEGKESETYGYNGAILGPVLSLNSNEKTKIKIKNNLSEETTVHWHGAIVSEEVDGVHNSEIKPNGEKEVEFTLNQPASTLWFHPHTMHKTASQVYKGLAGLIYLEDEMSKKLELPKTYGVDDFPIVIQDKKISEDGKLDYTTSHMEKIHGKSGGRLMVNGIISPYLDISNGMTRLRVVNGSNATNFNIDLSNKEFYQIASDGGFLKSPIKLNNLKLAPGERAELIIDSKDFNEKEYLYVNGSRALEFRKTNNIGLRSIPENLVEISKVDTENLKLNTRNFELKTTSNSNTINNTEYNMEKIDFNVKKGTKEIWNIINGDSMMDMPHPFHIHGAQFRIIERNGKEPPLNEQGWKDTVNIGAGENIKILIEYKADGIVVYHCHILEHEEMGMMGQFYIEK
ncbi:multicopper oxidase domain-containing protein [Fusobacterium sp.]|uniref:multicopper oxidase family protein n=1 Tax=Fusobacterium sp. TaxID=68766 RepID=UPI002609AAD1|nr:multicopper oxidase domain-containing protein [Fusobacterium sp.]